MTIQEAIKSGKPFKRQDWAFLCRMKEQTLQWKLEDELKWHVGVSHGCPFWYFRDDILADDWEVKES